MKNGLKVLGVSSTSTTHAGQKMVLRETLLAKVGAVSVVLRVRIESDSYDFQSAAYIQRFTDAAGWHDVARLAPQQVLAGLAYLPEHRRAKETGAEFERVRALLLAEAGAVLSVALGGQS